MGAWGSASFENDDACDWIADLREKGVVAIRAALRKVADATAGEYIEVPDASVAVAAAEVVAANRDGLTSSLAADVDVWLHANKGVLLPADVELACRAARRVLASSELRQLWDDNGPHNPWHSNMVNLISRLR